MAMQAGQWVEETIVPGELRVRCYGRRRGGGATPLVLHFHGGSFVAGSLDHGATVASTLAAAGAVVVSVDYPLAPDRPFPQAVEAGYVALEWVRRSRSRLAGARARLFVAGEEAGGNLAAAVALMARDRHGPALAGQILLSPMLDPCLGTASLRAAKGGAVGCRWADGWCSYLGSPLAADHPYAAPGSSSRLMGLPPTLLISEQNDPLRDEASQYARKLVGAGVTVNEVVLAGIAGWPCALMQPQAPEMPWLAALQRQFDEFMRAPAPGCCPPL
jgi:acetyl esterase/lipase